MSLQNELKAIIYFIPKLFQGLWEGERNVFRTYSNYIAILLVLVLISASSFFGYRWYVSSREQRAQQALAYQFEDYTRALQSRDAAGLSAIESACEVAYQQHTGSALAPLFLVLQADVQIKQEKYTQALNEFATRYARHSYALVGTRRPGMRLRLRTFRRIQGHRPKTGSENRSRKILPLLSLGRTLCTCVRGIQILVLRTIHERGGEGVKNQRCPYI